MIYMQRKTNYPPWTIPKYFRHRLVFMIKFTNGKTIISLYLINCQIWHRKANEPQQKNGISKERFQLKSRPVVSSCHRSVSRFPTRFPADTRKYILVHFLFSRKCPRPNTFSQTNNMRTMAKPSVLYRKRHHLYGHIPCVHKKEAKRRCWAAPMMGITWWPIHIVQSFASSRIYTATQVK